jgi:uncharacterized protein (UPF0333 family)
VEIVVVSLVLIVPIAVIIYLCYTWMQSTRASQRRTEAQNQKVIELLSEIASELRNRP